MVTLFITSRNSIPQTLEELHGAPPTAEMIAKRQQLNDALRELEEKLLSLDFSIRRDRNPIQDTIEAQRTFSSLREIPHLGYWIGLTIGWRINTIRLESDLAVERKTRRLCSLQIDGFYITEGRQEQSGKWFLELSMPNKDYQTFCIAIVKFQEVLMDFLKDIATFQLASQIVGLVSDFQNGKNPGALNGVIDKAERLKLIGQDKYPHTDLAETLEPTTAAI